MRAASLVALLVLFHACRAPEPSTSASTVEVERTTDAGVAPAEPPKPKAGPPARIIEDGNVGDLVPGKPIPAEYLADARYEARWVADAQPMDGFYVGQPPILVIIEGPLHGVDPGPLEPLKEKLAPKALEMARAGAPILGILIEQPGVKTAEGIGIGSTFAELESLYGKIQLLRNPEEFDNNITCVATVSAFTRVRFHLATCKEGSEYGPVKRIIVSQ